MFKFRDLWYLIKSEVKTPTNSYKQEIQLLLFILSPDQV